MLRPEVSAVAIVGNAVAAIAATLLPGAVVRLPALCTVLLPCAVLDPALCLRPRAPLLPMRLLGTLYLPLRLGMPLLSLLLWVLSTPLLVWFGLLLSVLRRHMLRRPRLLLSALLLVAISRPLGRPRHLLGMLPLVLFSPLGLGRLRLPLPLLWLSLLLSMMRFRTGLFMLALLFGTVPFSPCRSCCG